VDYAGRGVNDPTFEFGGVQVKAKKRPLGTSDHKRESILGSDKGKTTVNPQPAGITAEVDSMRIEATIEEYRKFAVDILKNLGLPSDWPSLLGHFDDNALEPEWYARKMLFWTKSLEEHLANQNAGGAALAAMRLQSAIGQFLVSRMEYAVLAGNVSLTTQKSELQNSKSRKQDGRHRVANLRKKGNKVSAKQPA
jgi:hypothetical protein